MTAVEWLWKALLDSGFEDIEDVEGFYYQALKMEKQQIIESNRDGVDMCVDKKPFISGEQYYNETFKSDKI